MIRAAIVLYLLWVIVDAHVARADDYAPWVDQLRTPGGTVCCHNNDGRRLDDPEWRTAGDSYEVLFTEGWVAVPKEAIVQMRNQDGIARVWSEMGGDGKRRIRCFLAGAFG